MNNPGLIFILMTVTILVVSTTFYMMEMTDFNQRFHQHSEYTQEEMVNLEAYGIKSHLPIIEIDTDGQMIPGNPVKDQVNVYEVTSDGENSVLADLKLYFHTEENNKNYNVRVRYRGNSSRYFDKKSYALRLVDENGQEQREALLGMETHDEWVLNGPYLDRSLLRNYLAMNLSGEIMPYAPDVRYVELIVGGRYEGIYLLMETITKGDGRVEVKEPSRNSHVTGYILEMDRSNKMKKDYMLNEFLTYTLRSEKKGFEMVYPGQNRYSVDRRHYVEEDFTRIVKSLYEKPLEDSYNGIVELIDVRAFQDYFIINELFRNVDSGYYSTFFYKDVRGLLTPVVWDFNNSLDNYQESTHSVGGFSLASAVIFDTLLKEPIFVEGLINRYYSLREKVLNEDRIMEYIDNTILYLGSSVERNNTRWNNVYDLTNYNEYEYLTPSSRNVESYEEAVLQMKSFLLERGRWMDKHINHLRQYSHPSRNSFESTR